MHKEETVPAVRAGAGEALVHLKDRTGSIKCLPQGVTLNIHLHTLRKNIRKRRLRAAWTAKSLVDPVRRSHIERNGSGNYLKRSVSYFSTWIAPNDGMESHLRNWEPTGVRVRVPGSRYQPLKSIVPYSVFQNHSPERPSTPVRTLVPPCIFTSPNDMSGAVSEMTCQTSKQLPPTLNTYDGVVNGR